MIKKLAFLLMFPCLLGAQVYNPTTSAAPTGTAAGDLSGTYPNPGVAKVNGAAVPTSAAVLSSNSSNQLTSAGTTGSGNVVLANAPFFNGNSITYVNSADTALNFFWHAGNTTDQVEQMSFQDKSGVTQYDIQKNGANWFFLNDDANSYAMFGYLPGNYLRINAPPGALPICFNCQNSSGTSGIQVASGAASSAVVASIDGSGKGSFTSVAINGIASQFITTANFTTAANTSLQTITGLSWTLIANTAQKVPFRCHLAYSQATAAVAVAFGIQAATIAPNQIFATGEQHTAATAVTAGVLANLTTTTATNIVSATPGATATNNVVTLDGEIDNPSNASANVINIMVSTATAADVVTVLQGSFCRIN